MEVYLRTQFLRLLLVGCCLWGGETRKSWAETIAFDSMKVLVEGGSEGESERVLNGQKLGPKGWTAAPQVSTAQSALFRARRPVQQGMLRITLFFPPFKSAHFQRFSIAATTDPAPDFKSDWIALIPLSAYGNDGNLDQARDLLLAEDGNPAPFFVINVLNPKANVTGIRIQVSPTGSPPRVGTGSDGDFCLTEIRLEERGNETDNIALGCRVTSSGPLYGKQRPEDLTDGMAGSWAHPLDGAAGSAFFFIVDFATIQSFDHLALKNRSDGKFSDRLSNILLELYDQPPRLGIAPVWTARHREDGSSPPSGASDFIHAKDGAGTFKGRYLRISSIPPKGELIPKADTPQLAEVEAYIPWVAGGLRIREGETEIPTDVPIAVPVGTKQLSISVQVPKLASELLAANKILMRWRMAGKAETSWQLTQTCEIVTPCPPPGNYHLEIQIQHSDGEWNESLLSVPLEVLTPFWQQRSFIIVSRWLAGISLIGILISGAWLIRHRAGTMLKRRVRDLERTRDLETERTRIARDMHDVVGARLTQLAVLHEVFAAEHTLPASAADGLQALTEAARAAVAELDEVVWAVNPRNDTLPSVVNYLCHCASEYLRPLDIVCRHRLPATWPKYPVNARARHELLLALKEALQNVVKHSAATQVTLILSYQAPELILELTDNGRGLPAEISGKEKDGLENMGVRLRSVGGDFRIFSDSGAGTTVQMRLPIFVPTAPCSHGT